MLNDSLDLRVLTVVVATPEARGGAIRAGLKLGDHLAKFVGADLAKMSGEHDKDLIDELGLSSDLIRLPSNTRVRDLVSHFTPANSKYENALIWTHLSDVLSSNEYDIVHIHNSVPIAGMVAIASACRYFGVPYCVTTHGFTKVPKLPDQIGMSWPVATAYEWGVVKPYYWVLKNADHLFTLSDNDEQLMTRELPYQSTSVVPNGVDLNLPINGDQNIRMEYDLPKSKPIILFVGKLMRSKGIDDLLAAIDMVEADHTLLIVGDALEQRYVDRIEAMDDDSVRYLGYVDQSSLDALYREAELFAFPTRSDVYPLTVLEALAAGTPVVSTNVGGIPDQLSEAVGVVVPPESPDDVANAIQSLLKNKDRRERMAKRAIKRAEQQFSWNRVAEEVVNEYINILESTHK